jgi:hypothetical protein
VPLKLIDQDELEMVCPTMVEELDQFIDNEDVFKNSDEATIYAISQLLHNRIDKIDLTPEDKGALISSVIAGLVEFNSEVLAIHNEVIKTLLEQKASTIH